MFFTYKKYKVNTTLCFLTLVSLRIPFFDTYFVYTKKRHNLPATNYLRILHLLICFRTTKTTYRFNTWKLKPNPCQIPASGIGGC